MVSSIVLGDEEFQICFGESGTNTAPKIEENTFAYKSNSTYKYDFRTTTHSITTH